MLLQNAAVDLKAVLRPQGDGDHHAAGLGDHVFIVHKGGGEDDDLVPLVDGGHKGHVHRLGPAAGEQHFCSGVIVQVKVPAEIFGDLGAQAQGAAVGGIVGLVLQQGLNGLFLDEVWGVEVGLAGGQGDDGMARLPNLGHLLHHLADGGEIHALQALGAVLLSSVHSS